MSLIKKLIILILGIYMIFLFCCSLNNGRIPVTHIIKKSGENSKEIQKVYDYFMTKGDSLQLEALIFLLENMEEHSFSEIALFDTNKVEVDFCIYDHENYSSARAELDSLSDLFGDLNWRSKTRSKDLETVTAEFLINNIELAFDSWRKFPWAQNYSFELFREYILPYRGSNEPLESWRYYFLHIFNEFNSVLEDEYDPLEAAVVINDSLKKMFGFDPKFYLNPTDQGLSEMLENKLGRCEDMTNFSTYALRANGIAVSSDYTPYWADSGNNHAWNVIILPDGNSVPFMGCEADPGNYNLRSRMAKAYRKVYSFQQNPLTEEISEKNNIPPWLSGNNYIDVTTQYTPVSDVEYHLDMSYKDSCQFAYLCVFNTGEWKAIQYGRILDNMIIFKDMGTDLCYLPALYRQGELIPLGAPFILTPDNNIVPLSGNELNIDQKLYSVTKRIVEDATDNSEISYFNKNKIYELYYWNKDWILFDEQVAEEGALMFKEVPQNYLYWLIEKDSRQEERIFTYEDGKQIWW
jgi:transglutaminase superfamily protein